MEGVVADVLGFFATLSRDAILAGLLVGVPALYAVRAGKYRLVALNLGLYPAFAAYAAVPFFADLSFAGEWTVLIVLAALTLVAAAFIGRVVCAEFPSFFVPKFVDAAALSLSFAGALIFAAGSVPGGVSPFASGLSFLFTHPLSALWLAAPIVSLALSARRF